MVVVPEQVCDFKPTQPTLTDVSHYFCVEITKVIITSKIWRSSFTGSRDDFLIIGSPLDVAIAANTKFNILFAQRSQGYKLKLILGIDTPLTLSKMT